MKHFWLALFLFACADSEEGLKVYNAEQSFTGTELNSRASEVANVGDVDGYDDNRIGAQGVDDTAQQAGAADLR